MTNEEAQIVIGNIPLKPEVLDDCYSITEYQEAKAMAIKALEQESIIDKIRAEIEKTTSRYAISRERGAMGQVEWSDRLIKENEVLQIIDKYKTESEVQE